MMQEFKDKSNPIVKDVAKMLKRESGERNLESDPSKKLEKNKFPSV
jgi:hypothetical protein